MTTITPNRDAVLVALDKAEGELFAEADNHELARLTMAILRPTLLALADMADNGEPTSKSSAYVLHAFSNALVSLAGSIAATDGYQTHEVLHSILEGLESRTVSLFLASRNGNVSIDKCFVKTPAHGAA